MITNVEKVPISEEAAREEYAHLRQEKMEIERQCAIKNVTNNDKRSNSPEYLQWWHKAQTALKYKERRIIFLKQWIHKQEVARAEKKRLFAEKKRLVLAMKRQNKRKRKRKLRARLNLDDDRQLWFAIDKLIGQLNRKLENELLKNAEYVAIWNAVRARLEFNELGLR